MKKCISVALLIALCLTVTLPLAGCGLINSILTDIANETDIGQARKQAEAKRLDLSETLMSCLKEQDADGLAALLCRKSQALPCLDRQITDGLAFIRGNIVDYSIDDEDSGESVGKTDGTIDLYGCYGGISNVTTDAGYVYEIGFRLYTVIDDADRVGVTVITLTDTAGTDSPDDDTSVSVGYDWRENYVYEASVAIQDAIQAISDGDTDTLRAAFAPRVTENDDFDAQAQAVIDFFDGHATFGTRTTKLGDTYVDGDHDFFHASVKDEVTVENGRETAVYVTVTTVNIETDSGKVYTMEWAAYLSNEQEPTLRGLLYLTLTDGDGRVTVGTDTVKSY